LLVQRVGGSVACHTIRTTLRRANVTDALSPRNSHNLSRTRHTTRILADVMLGGLGWGCGWGRDEGKAKAARSTEPRHCLTPGSTGNVGAPFDAFGCHGTAVAHHPETGATLEGARRRRSSTEPPTRMHFALSMTKDRSSHPSELSGALKTRSVSHFESKVCQRFMWPPRRAQVAGCREKLFSCKCKGESCRQNSAVCCGNKLVSLGASFS